MSTPAELLTEAIGCHQAGQLVEAEKLYSAILQGDPGHADALHLLGLVAYQKGQHHAACEFISKAIAGNSMAPEYYNSLGAVKQAQGDKDEAVRLYLQAIQLKDDYLEPYRNLLRLCPESVEVYFNLGCVLQRQGKFSEAAEQYEKVIELQPDHARAFNNMGCALRELGRFVEAISFLRKAVVLQPEYDEAHNNLGLALHDNGRSAEAINSYNAALRYKDDSAEVYCNIGQAFHHLERHDEAVEQYERAIRIDPTHSKAYYSLACVLSVLGRYTEAIDKQQQAIQLKPDYIEAHVNKAFWLLLSGRYLEGWSEYEWRMKRADWLAANSYYEEIPRWDGSVDGDKSIVVLSEQGFGDTIHFARYLHLVKACCRKLIVEAQPELHPLLAMIHDIDELTLKGSGDSRQADLAVSIMSLPGIFQATTENIPSVFPYLHAPTLRREKFKARFSQENFNIGIAWSGNTAHPENVERSCDIELFCKLANLPAVRLFSLQKGDPAEDINKVPAGLVINDLSHDLHDFADTAAVIEHLDMVISVDTALVHLAGAMGKPVWTLRYHVPYWVWGLDGSETLWYPSMRIFRQKKSCGWGELFEQVVAELVNILPPYQKEVSHE